MNEEDGDLVGGDPDLLADDGPELFEAEDGMDGDRGGSSGSDGDRGGGKGRQQRVAAAAGGSK